MLVCNRLIIVLVTFSILTQIPRGTCQLTDKDVNIIKVESIIRTTANDLFYIMGARKLQEIPRLHKNAIVHDHFITQTLQGSYIDEIYRLTRVEKNDRENITKFMNVIDEIVYEDKLYKTQNMTTSEENPDDEFEMEKLNQLKKYYAESNIERNNELAKAMVEKGSQYNTSEVKIERRIYGGKRTKIKKFPFMASVQIFGRFHCAGSIIKSDLVITAASCLQLAWNNRFFRENPAFLSVRIGSSFYEIGGESIDVMEVYFHPSYNPRTLNHNVAIMRLLRRIKFRKKRVKKISIADGLPSNGGRVTVVGWGANTRANTLHGPSNDKLRHASIDMYHPEDCKDIYTKQYVSSKTHFCAGMMSAGSGACNRDLGGPGIMRGKLVGVISFGSPVCGSADIPTVFTKLSYYIDWIEEIMDQKIKWVKKRTTTQKPHKKYSSSETSQEKLDSVSSKEDTTTEDMKEILRQIDSSKDLVSSKAENSKEINKQSKLAFFNDNRNERPRTLSKHKRDIKNTKVTANEAEIDHNEPSTTKPQKSTEKITEKKVNNIKRKLNKIIEIYITKEQMSSKESETLDLHKEDTTTENKKKVSRQPKSQEDQVSSVTESSKEIKEDVSTDNYDEIKGLVSFPIKGVFTHKAEHSYTTPKPQKPTKKFTQKKLNNNKKKTKSKHKIDEAKEVMSNCDTKEISIDDIETLESLEQILSEEDTTTEDKELSKKPKSQEDQTSSISESTQEIMLEVVPTPTEISDNPDKIKRNISIHTTSVKIKSLVTEIKPTTTSMPRKSTKKKIRKKLSNNKGKTQNKHKTDKVKEEEMCNSKENSTQDNERLNLHKQTMSKEDTTKEDRIELSKQPKSPEDQVYSMSEDVKEIVKEIVSTENTNNPNDIKRKVPNLTMNSRVTRLLRNKNKYN